MIEIGNGCKIKNCQIFDSGNEKLIVNGKEIPRPPIGMDNVAIINDKIFVGGYEYKDGGMETDIESVVP